MAAARQPTVLLLDVYGVLNSFFLDFLEVDDVHEAFGTSRSDKDPSYGFEDKEGQFRPAGSEFVDRVLSQSSTDKSPEEVGARDSADFPVSSFAKSKNGNLAKRAKSHQGFRMQRFAPNAPDVLYNPAITNRLALIFKSKDYNVEPRWCTSWQALAPKYLGPVFGFPEMPDSLAGYSSSGYKPVVANAVDSSRPLVWLDDDIRCREWGKL